MRSLDAPISAKFWPSDVETVAEKPIGEIGGRSGPYVLFQLLLVQRIRGGGWRIAAAALAAGLS
jgi:hypothetical protein